METDNKETETNKKEPPEEKHVLRRMTKMQVQEVYGLLEEGKTLEEISNHFEKKYKCKPLPKDRLRKHLTKFYKLKSERENGENDDAGNNTSHSLQPPVSIITNQDIRQIKETLFSAPPTKNHEKSLVSVENSETVSKETDDSLSGIPLKFLVFVVIVVLLLLKILMRRQEKKGKSKPEEPEQQNKSEKLRIKWV